MPVMSDTQSVAANTTVANVLSGKAFEFVPFPALVRVYACSSATGINCSLLVGGVSVVQDQLISHANRYPIVPDDLLAEQVAPAGARLVLSVRNTTGGALTVWTKTEVIPLR